MFQFHRGAIQTSMALPILPAARSFNSIEVRFKPYIDYIRYKGSEFQFHRGAIQTSDEDLVSHCFDVSIP